MMRTIVTTLSLLSLTFVAAPAAAVCTSTPTDGYACVDVYGPNDVSAYAWQPGVGGADASIYQFEFWGQTYRGKNVAVYTTHDSPVGSNSVYFSEFCFADASGGCMYQDDSLFVYSEHAGYAYVSASQAGDWRYVCASGAGVWHCQEI